MLKFQILNFKFQVKNGQIKNLHTIHHRINTRAAVMSAWYPVLYPDPSPKRKSKLAGRRDWPAGDTKMEFSEGLLVCSSEVPSGIWDTGDFLEAQREARAREPFCRTFVSF